MRERKPPAAPPSPSGMLDRLGRWCDRAVLAILPERGLRRMMFRAGQQRAALQAARMQHTDGGEKDESRARSWLGSRLSPDSGLEQDQVELRKNSRELYLNDTIGGAVDSRMNLVVSRGFTPQARIKARPGLCSQAEADRYNDEFEEVYRRLGPGISKSGKQTLWQLLRLIERHVGFDGEAFVLLADRGGADKPIPLTLDVIDPERVETPPQMGGKANVRMGVETDAGGRIVAYHVRDAHPGDSLDVKQTYTRYLAERVLHVYEPWFAGQSRAFPWLTRAIKRAKDAKDFDEATIIAAQIQACYAVFVTAPLGALRAAEGAATDLVNGQRVEDIRPGSIKYLEDGQTAMPGGPSSPGNTFEPFQQWNYRRIAAGINWPFEMVAKNWSGLSFAAGRLALTDCKLSVRADQQLLDQIVLQIVWARLVYEAVLAGATSLTSKRYRLDPWWFSQVEWSAPPWPFALTPGEEVDAELALVNNNIKPKASMVAEYTGGDFIEVANLRAAERALERELEIEPATAEVPEATLKPQTLESVGAK